MIENKARGKTCTSGIGDERKKQMQQAKRMLEASKDKKDVQHGTGAIGAIDSMFVKCP